jgi:hypothetical protein
MQRVRTIILIAKSNGWIHADPFANYELQTEKTEREFLNEQKLDSNKQCQKQTYSMHFCSGNN